MPFRATRALLRATITTGSLSHFPPQKRTATTTTKPTNKPTILEVERKFRRLTVPTSTNIHHHTIINNKTSTTTRQGILNYKHSPNFTSVTALPTCTIHDIYYDTPDRALCSRGAWIRQRNGEWEAKVKRAWWKGDFVNRRFEELHGEKCAGGMRAEEEDYSGRLGKLAEFVTTREAWLVHGEFKVVELQVEVHDGGGDGKTGQEEKAALMDEMDRKIEAFMKRYAWAWEEGEAVDLSE
ncbi:hypothetical protein N657DRAFT_673462 [Parathielavia appendiculata]|uniref:CYTH domain-containing protein n=1 Tax=Parathielavia appendiculata TaxID=2587402 RepID=A0AAN6TWB2_9PEZI|nr:hypothetical protein N657DRAFT_673462 [Parathielavia appendiculata]